MAVSTPEIAEELESLATRLGVLRREMRGLLGELDRRTGAGTLGKRNDMDLDSAVVAVLRDARMSKSVAAKTSGNPDRDS